MSNKGRSHTGVTITTIGGLPDEIKEYSVADASDDEPVDNVDSSNEDEEKKRDSQCKSNESYGRVFGLLAEDDLGMEEDDDIHKVTNHFSFVDTNLDKFNILQFVHEHETRATVLSPNRLINNNENNE